MGEENPSGLSTASSQQHVFKLPTAKPSLLGLDTLAKAQRRLNGPISVDLEHDDDMSGMPAKLLLFRLTLFEHPQCEKSHHSPFWL